MLILPSMLGFWAGGGSAGTGGGGGGGYSLKNTGLATSLTACVAVDQDGTTINDFVTPGSITIDSGVTTGSATWKSVSRGYFTTLDNGGFNFFGIRWPSTKPSCPFAAGTGCSWFAAFNSLDAVGTRILWGTNNSTYMKQNSSKLRWTVSSVDATTSASTTLTTSTKLSVGGTWRNSATPGGQYFYGLESGSLGADGTTDNGTGQGSNTNCDSFGGSAGQGSQASKCHIFCIFSGVLTLSDFQSLHNDWFGTLFN